VDDQLRLLERVRASSASVAVYDVSDPAILAASPHALEQLGFAGVELASVDIVESSRDPEGTRKLLALIRDGHLKSWRVRSWLRTSDGDGFWDCGTGHAVDVEGRRLGVVTYPASASNAPGFRVEQRRLGDIENHEELVAARQRIAELEGRLRRILGEVQDAGLLPELLDGVVRSDIPGFEQLSLRELEIITRMLHGDRVPTIAKGLHVSHSTVRNHLSKIYRKVGVRSQVELIEALRGSRDAGAAPR
jgi:DNA-binding CsgD family transcriptional regulator